MVAPVPAHISKFPPHSPQCAAASLLTTHHPLPTLFLPPLCFHTLTNCFSRNPFIFTSIQIPRGCGGQEPKAPHGFLCASVPLWQIHLFQELAASLSSLCALFCTRLLCFQSFAASFPNPPGVGVSQHFCAELRFRLHMRHVAPQSPAPSLDCAYFPSPRGCTSPFSRFGLLVPTPPPDLE